jgi:hypothetical protein
VLVDDRAVSRLEVTHLLMTRKSQRKNKSRGADLEAQPEDGGVLYNLPCTTVTALTLLYKEVREKDAYEMKIHTSRRDSEASEAFGSDVPERKKDREVHAHSSAHLQVGGQNDNPSNSGNSGKHSTFS